MFKKQIFQTFKIKVVFSTLNDKTKNFKKTLLVLTLVYTLLKPTERLPTSITILTKKGRGGPTVLRRSNVNYGKSKTILTRKWTEIKLDTNNIELSQINFYKVKAFLSLSSIRSVKIIISLCLNPDKN